MRHEFRRFAKLFLAAFFIICMVSTISWAQGGRKIVIFTEDYVNAPAQAVLVERFGGVVRKELGIVNGLAVVLPQAALNALSINENVFRIDDDVIVTALPKPPDKPGKPGGGGGGGGDEQPPQGLPWGVDRIDAEYAHAAGYTGAGVKVAVVDTGIDYRHPDLDANCKGGVNIIHPRKDYKDDSGHGTHVAGIIAAEDNEIGVVGVAPNASLYGVKVLDRNGSGYLSDVLAGIEWCVVNNMNILNMSLGTDSNILSLKEACDDAKEAGLILVAAAGNDGHLGGNSVDYPAAYDSVIAVAATDSNDVRAYWSSYGPQVVISAPGVDVTSTWKGGGYSTEDGTSMASPHVAGTLALIHPAADIYSTADDLAPAGWDMYTGYGLVDAQEAATGSSDGND
jgi:subtilisin family serine protease